MGTGRVKPTSHICCRRRAADTGFVLSALFDFVGPLAPAAPMQSRHRTSAAAALGVRA